MRKLLIAAGAGIVLLAAAAAWFYTTKSAPGPGAVAGKPAVTADAEVKAPAGCVLDVGDKIGGPISLIDQNGESVTEEHFTEGATLIYFGFTYCPDVCPLALQTEKATLEKLGQEGGVIQPVLISLDPARDTPEQLDKYVKSEGFPMGLLGLTGTDDQVAAAAKAFRVSWRKETDENSAAQYSIAHSSYFYLMDENWALKAFFPSTTSPDDAAACIKAGLQG